MHHSPLNKLKMNLKIYFPGVSFLEENVDLLSQFMMSSLISRYLISKFSRENFAKYFGIKKYTGVGLNF